MTPKRRLKAIQKACEQAEAALNTLRPLIDDDVCAGDWYSGLHGVIHNMKVGYAELAEEATDGK